MDLCRFSCLVKLYCCSVYCYFVIIIILSLLSLWRIEEYIINYCLLDHSYLTLLAKFCQQSVTLDYITAAVLLYFLAYEKWANLWAHHTYGISPTPPLFPIMASLMRIPKF